MGLKKNHYVMMKGHPCKVVKTATSKTGKHGHAKVTYDGVCVFTGKKYSDVQPGHANLLEPVITKQNYSLMDVDVSNGTLSALDESNNEQVVDFDADSKVGQELIQAFDDGQILLITTLSGPEGLTEPYNDKEMLLSFQEDRNE